VTGDPGAPRRTRGRRPRILFVWELGANYGHASKIIETFVALGPLAEVVIAAREPQAFAEIAPRLGLNIRPAPHAPPPPPPPLGPAPPVLNYTDSLRFCGWTDAVQLAGLIRSWRDLFAEVAPDLIVTQAAPTALLAARGGRWPVVTLGSGFDAPARADPMPAYPGDHTAADLRIAEDRTLAVAEAALRETGSPALGQLRAIFDAGPMLLAAMIQTDHYHPRRQWEPGHPPYLGHLFTIDRGSALDWAGDGRARILAYLRPGAHGFAATAQALAARGRTRDIVLAAPGLPAAAAASLRAAGLRVVDGPLRLDLLLPEADLMVSHGSNGVVAAGLVAGVPQFLVPTQTEQYMLTRAVAAQKLAFGLTGRPDPAAVSRTLEDALASRVLRASARAVAATIAAKGNVDPAAGVAARLLAIAAGTL